MDLNMENNGINDSVIYSGENDINKVEDYNAEYNSEKDYTTLDAWKNCRNVKLFFYNKIVPHLPPDEKYNLSIQVRKASVSITANIAEGYGRFHYKEGIQFYRISRGSLYELKDHLITCYELNYISNDLFEEGKKLIEKSKRTLNGYIKFVTQQSK